jgi:hypothetical protein
MVGAGSDGTRARYATGMTDAKQQADWLEWERELRRAAVQLRADGGPERVLRLLEHHATVALHNAYCGEAIPFPRSGVPTA